MHIKKLIGLPPLQNTPGICKHITILILDHYSSRLVIYISIQVSNVLVLVLSYKLINFFSLLCILYLFLKYQFGLRLIFSRYPHIFRLDSVSSAVLLVYFDLTLSNMLLQFIEFWTPLG
jgi:hypothetical protein